MSQKLTYRELEQKIKELKKKAFEQKRTKEKPEKYRHPMEKLVKQRASELQKEISERKKQEIKWRNLNLELKQTRDYLKNVFENSADAIGIVDKYGKFIEWNHTAEHLYGYNFEELKGTSFKSLYPDKIELDNMLRKLRVEGFVRKYEINMKNKAGTILPFELSISLLKDKNSNNIGSVCVARDLSERKRVENELRHSREKYRDLYEEAKKTEELYHSLLDSTPDAIAVYDINGRTQYINDAFTRIFGWFQDEIRYGAPYVPDSEKQITSINLKKVVQDGIPISHFETERFTKDGQLINVSISASRFNDHEGKPAGMLVILRDITAQKQAEKELRKYSEIQEVLLREVNHRVKNNLSAIIGMLYKEEDRAMAVGLTDYLHFLNDLQGRIAGLSAVHSLLSAANWQPLLLSRLCEEVINGAVQGSPLDTKISIEIKDSPVKINSNQAHHLTLVINELASNTLKHALGNRNRVRIAVGILLENNDIHIVYCDDGPGYPQEMVDGDFNRANVGFDLINGIVEESLKGRVMLRNENGAVTNIVFKHDMD